jgi:hypothetical protein
MHASNEVPGDAIQLIAGPAHCGLQGVLLLTTGWPIGERYTSDRDARQYVRDVGGRLAGGTVTMFGASVTLPADAAFTGYRYGSDELWISPATADRAVYLVRGNVVEQWPRVTEFVACA